VQGESCGGSGTPNVCGAGTCVPKTCDDLGAKCGSVQDGCGGTIQSCGTCVDPDECGGGGKPNECGCTALTCTDFAGACGALSDGCGRTIDCSCSNGAECRNGLCVSLGGDCKGLICLGDCCNGVCCNFNQVCTVNGCSSGVDL
jgi:hypothetical protein